MEFLAKSKHIRQSPRKIRQVVDTVRGKNVAQATKTLSFTNKKAATFILKTINSAVSNCLSNNESADVDNLYIKSITVDGGPVFKRWKPAAYGRAVPRLKRTSHLTVVVSNKQN